MFVGDSKRSGLSGSGLFQLLQPSAQPVVAIVEIPDLLFEFLNFSVLLFNHASLAQNDFDEPIGLLAQRLQTCLSCDELLTTANGDKMSQKYKENFA